jgi:hypothetical protein
VRRGRDQPKLGVAGALADTPLDRGPQVVVLGLEPADPGQLVAPDDPWLGCLGPGEAPVAVTRADRGRLTRVEQLLAGVLLDGLGQPVARPVARLVGDRQRLVHQPGQQVEHVVGVDPLTGSPVRRTAGPSCLAWVGSWPA